MRQIAQLGQIMNIHFMYDEKFINLFIEKYLRFHPLNKNKFFIIQTFKNEELKHVNNPIAKKIILNKKTLKKLIIENNNIENIFFHNFPLNIFSIIGLIPNQIKIHWIFYGIEIFKAPISLKILDGESLSIYPKIYKTNKLFRIVPDRFIMMILIAREKFWIYQLSKVLKKIDNFYHWNKYDYLYIKRVFPEFSPEFRNFGYNTNYKRTLEDENHITNVNIMVNLPKKLIMIGNNSSLSLNHLSIIKFFAQFDNPGFTIILPLNYGNMNYKKYLLNYSKNLLGDKLVVLDNFLSYFEYRKIISNIDVLIMNNIRPQGAGNVHIALHEGKKIYMNPKNTHYRYLIDNGIVIKSTEDLFNSSIMDILNPLEKEVNERNRQLRIELDKKSYSWYKNLP